MRWGSSLGRSLRATDTGAACSRRAELPEWQGPAPSAGVLGLFARPRAGGRGAAAAHGPVRIDLVRPGQAAPAHGPVPHRQTLPERAETPVLLEGLRDDLPRYLNQDLLLQFWPVLRTLVGPAARAGRRGVVPAAGRRGAAALRPPRHRAHRMGGSLPSARIRQAGGRLPIRSRPGSSGAGSGAPRTGNLVEGLRTRLRR
jgi:hypothetical protein